MQVMPKTHDLYKTRHLMEICTISIQQKMAVHLCLPTFTNLPIESEGLEELVQLKFLIGFYLSYLCYFKSGSKTNNWFGKKSYLCFVEVDVSCIAKWNVNSLHFWRKKG